MLLTSTAAVTRAAASLSISSTPRSALLAPMGAAAVRHGGSYRTKFLKRRKRFHEKAWMHGESQADWTPETKSVRDWHFKLWDMVEVIKGPVKGERGQVIETVWRRNKVVVEGVNLRSTQVMDMESSPFAPKFKTESEPQPLYFRDVALIDPQTDKPVKGVRWEQLEDGRHQRVCEASGNVIPLPRKPEPKVVDYAESMCTPARDVLEVTYVPLPDHSTKIARLLAHKAAKAESSSSEAGSGAES
jgi:large subunit ribosomal protein L24